MIVDFLIRRRIRNFVQTRFTEKGSRVLPGVWTYFLPALWLITFPRHCNSTSSRKFVKKLDR